MGKFISNNLPRSDRENERFQMDMIDKLSGTSTTLAETATTATEAKTTATAANIAAQEALAEIVATNAALAVTNGILDATKTESEAHIADGTIHHTFAEIEAEFQAATTPDSAITATGPAGLLYTSTEQDIINALVADITTLNNALNELKAHMRTSGLLAP